jgi:hypothetical protein
MLLELVLIVDQQLAIDEQHHVEVEVDHRHDVQPVVVVA